MSARALTDSGRWIALTLLAAGTATATTGLMALLGWAFAVPLLFSEVVISPVLNTSLVILIIGLALVVFAGRRIQNRRGSPDGAPKGRLAIVTIFVGFAVSSIIAGYANYRHEEQELRDETEHELDVVSKLKAAEVSQWRNERLGDADILFRNASFHAMAERFLHGPDDATSVRELQEWLRKYSAYVDYDRSFLIDAQGTTRLSWPAPLEPASETIVRKALEALRTGQIEWLDFYLDESDQRARLAIVIPVRDESEANRPIGVLVLRIDPKRFLYPSVKAWPTMRKTADTLLVRRDGADVLYLDHPNSDPGAASHRRTPLEQTRALAVKAVLGQTGVAEGVDYRGVPVVGVLRAIPDSPWYLVTQMEVAELRAALWTRLWAVVAFTSVLLLGVGSCLGLLLRSQRTRFYERRAALAAALQESEERLRLALSAASQGLWDLNVQSGDAIVSPEYATMLGYDPAEFHETNAAWIERLHPEDREPVASHHRDYIAGRHAVYSLEFRQRTKDGDWKWILSRGKLIARAPDGRPLRMIGTHTDITSRKRAEIRANRLSQLYAALSQCNQAIVRCRNTADLFPEVCKAAVVLGGMAMAWIGLVDEASGLIVPVASYGAGTEYLDGIRISVNPDESFGRGPMGTAVRENRPFWVADFLHDPATTPWHASGERHGWVGAGSLPLTRNGRAIGALTIYAFSTDAFDDEVRALLVEMASDISFAMDTFAHVARREEAEASVLLQSAALNAAANAIVITDRDGTIEWVNPAFTAVTGYALEEAVGRNPRQLVKSCVHEPAFFEAMWRTIVAGHVWQGEITNRRKDGTLYVEEQTITPVKNAAGEITHFIGVKRDLTEQKRLQDQFLQAQKMEVVGRLAGGIAHDFNNLLTVINGTCELALVDLPADDPLRDEFEEIRAAGNRAARLTRQLLAFSRQQIVAPVVLSLSAEVTNAASMLRRLIGEDVNLVIVAPKEFALDNVRIDPGQLEQVLLNLAVNARDAMPAGGILTVETRNLTLNDAFVAGRPGATAGPHVMLAVSDTGVGMTAEIRTRIFEPFFTTKGQGKGTGLGLATVYGIVKQNGGFIQVDSEPGRGAAFKIFLPRAAGTPGGASAAAAMPAQGTETILLVEDEDGLRALIARVLRSAGYTVIPANGGSRALSALEGHHGAVHLLLTDVVMPDMSGPELASRLAKTHPEIKVLFASGYADDDKLGKDAFADTSNFIAKPFNVTELTKKVRLVLDAPVPHRLQ